MKLVKIATNSLLSVSEIKFITTYEGRHITNQIKKLKKEDKVTDLTRGKKVLSVIFLLDGTAVLVNSTPETINRRIEMGENGYSPSDIGSRRTEEGEKDD